MKCVDETLCMEHHWPNSRRLVYIAPGARARRVGCARAREVTIVDKTEAEARLSFENWGSNNLTT